MTTELEIEQKNTNVPGLVELFKAWVHFGHSTKRWNPNMEPFILTTRSKIHIINVLITQEKLREAAEFIQNQVIKGGNVLFVGTKPQARSIIKREAIRASSYYIAHRWLGGTITNFTTLEKRISRLISLEDSLSKGIYKADTKKESLKIQAEVVRLNKYFEGIKEMVSVPDMLFVVDPKHEDIAVKEAKKVGIPIIAIVDTNTDPKNITYPIPGNDDSIHSIEILTRFITDAIIQGKESYKLHSREKLAEYNALAVLEDEARRKRQEEAAQRHIQHVSKTSNPSLQTDSATESDADITTAPSVN